VQTLALNTKKELTMDLSGWFPGLKGGASRQQKRKGLPGNGKKDGSICDCVKWSLGGTGYTT